MTKVRGFCLWAGGAARAFLAVARNALSETRAGDVIAGLAARMKPRECVLTSMAANCGCRSTSHKLRGCDLKAAFPLSSTRSNDLVTGY